VIPSCAWPSRTKTPPRRNGSSSIRRKRQAGVNRSAGAGTAARCRRVRRLTQRRAVGGHESDRIRWLTVEMHLEVQVWTGRMAGRPDNSDDLPDHHGLSFLDGRPGEHVAVPGRDVAGMRDVDVPAAARCLRRAVDVAAVALRYHVAPYDGHGAGGSGFDEGAPGCAEVDAVSECLIAVSSFRSSSMTRRPEKRAVGDGVSSLHHGCRCSASRRRDD
jgi:hypothetical protein